MSVDKTLSISALFYSWLVISKLFVYVNYLTPGGAAIKFEAPMIQKLRCNLVQARFYWAPLIEIKDSLFLGKKWIWIFNINNIISYFIYRIPNIDCVILLLTIIISCGVHLLRTHFFKHSLMISVIFYQIWILNHLEVLVKSFLSRANSYSWTINLALKVLKLNVSPINFELSSCFFFV